MRNNDAFATVPMDPDRATLVVTACRVTDRAAEMSINLPQHQIAGGRNARLINIAQSCPVRMLTMCAPSAFQAEPEMDDGWSNHVSVPPNGG
ncbi:hypothetical protein SSBR45G_64000 [Bradyrhizobium sp. SSBR45G]|nr:hypothetical protein SSBR45G_64000 [Bradyrhizobium sp. SSBR45G]GLH88898.1 hypothetical protein SSBR45R_63590 [Bradyrhizobium sp. SSBR45R]